MDLSRILLASVLVAAALPAGLSTGAAEEPCQNDFSTTKYIEQSTPLEGQLSATQMVYEVTHRSETGEQEARWANGLDGYVYSVSCQPNPMTYSVYDRTPSENPEVSADYAIEFYDEDFQQIGDTIRETNDGTSAQLHGDAPKQTEYAVVLVEDAPLIAGITVDNGEPKPFAAKFELAFELPG